MGSQPPAASHEARLDGHRARSRVSLLLLWDVDHTLIDTGGVGRECYADAFYEATGRRVEQEVDVTGRTERAILVETARLHDVLVDSGLVERYRDELAHQYRRRITDLQHRGRVLPGAAEALIALARARRGVQTVLTGNFRTVTAIKLAAFDLERHLAFDVGAYGDDALDRADLVPVARQRLQRLYEVSADLVVIVIGDSVSDVSAARGKARTIAVASGKASARELASARPDVVLDDLFGLPTAVQSLAPAVSLGAPARIPDPGQP